MQSKYDKTRHVLVEQSEQEKPIAQDSDLKAFKIDDFFHRVGEYEMYIASLRTIPCAPGSIWEEDSLYEEGIDYEIKGADEWKWCYQLTGNIFAAPIPKEDDMWMSIIYKVLSQSENIFSPMMDGKRIKKDLCEEFAKHYTITKKTV